MDGLISVKMCGVEYVPPVSDRQKEDGTLVGMRRSFGLAMRHEDTSTLPIPCSREGTPTFPG